MRSTSAEMTQQLLCFACLERYSDTGKGLRHWPAVLHQPCRLAELAQLPAKRTKQRDRLLSLTEEFVQKRQRARRVALADQLEDLKRVLRPIVADQTVDVL